MDVNKFIRTKISDIATKLEAENLLPAGTAQMGWTVEATRDPAHGDLATNIALVLAKPAKEKPRDLAQRIVGALSESGIAEKIEIAGPGFINLTLSAQFWLDLLEQIARNTGGFGRSSEGEGQAVNVEFVSANPTGPLHVGHCRGAIFGDSLARLLEFVGYDVTREYYINDAGSQVDVLAQSAFLRYREALGEDIGEIGEGLYPGDYLIKVGEALAEEFGNKLLEMPDSQWLPIVRDKAIEMNMADIRDDLAALNIHHDNFFSERSLIDGKVDKVADTINWLQERDLVYEGRLPPPKGQLPDDWEDREQTLFRSTRFGDDVDRALKKSDGSYTYFASDMAYHKDKFERGFKTMINVLGADHGGYVKRMKAAVGALTEESAELDIKICQLVNLLRDGEPVKMSKRSGNIVTLRDVVDEVGRDVVRFMMLYRRNDAPLDFDFSQVLEQSKDNPVFYVQYAHARSHSVFRNAKTVSPEFDVEKLLVQDVDLSGLTDPAEISVIKKLGQFPGMIAAAASFHEPHRLAFYLYELAGEFHALWNRGKELPQLRFIREEDRPLTKARLILLWSFAGVLASGLNILGVKAIEEMR